MSEVIASRVRKLMKLLEKGINPYSITKYEVSAKAKEIKERFAHLKPGEETDVVHSVAGRIFSIRIHGGVAFADLRDESGKIQLMFRKDISKEAFSFLKNYLDEGDIVGAKGKVVRSKRGEISILVEEILLLAKALRPIPHEWYGVRDIETRYRQRYLDLIMNHELRENFKKISRMVNAMRSYLLSLGFIEVNTPILQPIYGGAFAKPFKTYHNFLEQEMYLRIAPELYLKRLLVGGFERVFEIGPCFRNESIDSTHNPEFIQLEAYQAYANYEDMMKLVENLIARAAEEALGTTRISYQGKEIELKPPWKRMKMTEAIKKYGKIDVEKMSSEEIINLAKEHGFEVSRPGEAIEELFGYFAQPHLTQPTFITHFPVDISPLAKKFPDGRYAERFEAYIAGMEVANAFSELNNPIEQYLRFKEEEELRKKSGIKEIEYMPMDKDYVRALEYGMPPAGGIGIGIARVASILLDKPSIKEVILFPAIAGIEKIECVAELFPELLKWFK